MRNAPMLEFPVSEFEHRISRLTAAMKQAGLDGILLTSKENTRYFCGLQSIIWSSKVSTPGILMLNADGAYRVVGSASASETARYTGCVEDELVLHFNRNNLPGIPATYPDALVQGLAQLGLCGKRVGMEYGAGCYLSLQLHWLDEVLEKSRIQAVDVSVLVLQLRSIKSEAEVGELRRTAELNERSLRYAFEQTELGKTTEGDFFRLYAQEAFRGGCENVLPLSVRFGPKRFGYANCPYRDDVRIEDVPHRALLVSGGLFRRGYYADAVRTGIVRGMSETQKLLHEACAETHRFALRTARAGMPVRELCREVDAFARQCSGAGAYLGCFGHGIGLDIREYPVLDSRSDAVLESGMVINLEVQYGDSETGLFCSEEPVLIGENSAKPILDKVVEPYIFK